MNLLGKIITLLIFLLSVCFLMIAVMVGASHQNWREIAYANKAKADQARDDKIVIQQQIGLKDKRLQEEQVMRMLQLQQLQSQLVMAEQNYRDSVKQLEDEQVKAQEALEQLATAEDRLKEQDGEVTQLKSQTKNLVEDVARHRESAVEMTNRIYELEGSIRTMETRRNALQEENALLTKVLRINGLTKNDMTAHIPPKLDGLVTKVGDDLIVVNLGTDDGLRAGHRLDIYRNDRYIGSADVTDPRFNRSAARVIKDLLQAPIQEGDRVTTEWSRPQGLNTTLNQPGQ